MSAIGQIPIAPSVTAPIPLGAVTATSLASLTLAQQDSIVRGTIVVTATQSFVYTGYGSKTSSANYVELVSSGYTTDSELASHEADTTNVHGIANTANLVLTNDPRLSDPRTPAFHAHGNINNNGSIPTADGEKTITLISGGTGYSSGSALINGIAVSISATSGVITSVTAVGSFSAVGTGYYQIVQSGNTSANVILNSVFVENLPLITTTNGKITTGSFGTTANTFCQGNDARLSDPRTPTTHTHPPSDITNVPSIQFSNIESSDFWFRRWGRSYGSLGYVQFCPIPLTPNSGVNPLYSDSALYGPNDFTDPGHNIEFTAPFVQDMLENPAHGLPFVVTPSDYKLYYSYTSKPSFIRRWRIKGEHWWSRPHSVDNNAGRVVNFTPTGVGQPTFTPGYPMFGTKCIDGRSMVRQGAYSHGAANGIATVADFVLAQTAQFKLGICIDAVADLNYRPDQIIVARGVATGSGGPAEPITYATEISSAVKATSSQIVGAVYPKLVIFNVSCNAGDTITVQFKSTGPSENNATWLTRAMAVSMFTFDPL